MPRKRKLPELSGDAESLVPPPDEPVKKQKHPSRPEPTTQPSKPRPRTQAFRKPRFNPNASSTPSPNSNPNSLNSLKTRIRNLRRLLEHTDHDREYKMPADVRVVRERELATCEHDLEEKTRAAKEAKYRQKMIGRYHQVRFFERQKATRVLKKISKEVKAASDPAEKAEALRRQHVAEVDLNYTLYYPLMRPYSALFPRNQGEGASADVEDQGTRGLDAGDLQDTKALLSTKGDPAMWKAVERAMEEGTLDALRKSKPSERQPQTTKQPQVAKKENGQKQKHVQKEKGLDQQGTYVKRGNTTVGASENEDSDGGFFE